MSTKNEGESHTSNKKVILLIVLLVVIILVLSGVVIYLMNRPDKVSDGMDSNKNKEDVKPMVVSEDNVDDIVDELEKNSADTMYNCRMSSSWTFDNGEAESKDAYVANTDYNHYPVYFEVQIDETEEIVYTSSYIPVGSEVAGLTLDKPLAAGDYPATVIYHLMNEDDEEVGSAGFTINIHVLH